MGDSQRFYIAAQVYILGSFHFTEPESCICEVVFEYAGNTIYAQGPMANTVHNFWAMVQVYTILQYTCPISRENIKCKNVKRLTHTCIQECDVHLIVMLTEVSGASKVGASKDEYLNYIKLLKDRF